MQHTIKTLSFTLAPNHNTCTYISNAIPFNATLLWKHITDMKLLLALAIQTTGRGMSLRPASLLNKALSSGHVYMCGRGHAHVIVLGGNLGQEGKYPDT